MRISELKRKNRVRSGFTLLELMLVMVILAILGGVMVTKFVGSTDKAKKSRAEQDMNALKTALSAFEGENSHFPTASEGGLQALVTKPSGEDLQNWTQRMEVIKPDPWGSPYVYKLHADNNGFDLYSCGPSKQDQGGSGDNVPAP